MRQVVSKTRAKANKKSVNKKIKLHKPNGRIIKDTKKFGTSKLEQDFAKDFLDKLGVDYIWQFEARDIGRFFDYYLPTHNLIIEVDGGYYHVDPRVVNEDKLNPMQKHNKTVDALKDKWALMHGIPVMRIWEKDIRENPKGVMKSLRERLFLEESTQLKKNEKNKRHVNKIKIE